MLNDCGLLQGDDASPFGGSGADRLAIESPLDTVKALIATRVLIDRVGRIPSLLAAGIEGPILCIEPSAKLLPIGMDDAFKLGISRDQALLSACRSEGIARIRPECSNGLRRYGWGMGGGAKRALADMLEAHYAECRERKGNWS